MHDGGIRVTLIVRWPGAFQLDLSRHPSAFWDCYRRMKSQEFR